MAGKKRLLGLSGTSVETTIRFCPEGALDVLITAARCVRAADNEMVVSCVGWIAKGF